MAEVCVARQPIFGTAGDVVGYELLHRCTSPDTSAAWPDRSVMAADVMIHAFLDIGLEQLTSGRPAYLDFTREMLLSRAYTLMPPASVTIELVEDITPDEAVEAVCEDLVD